MIAEPAKILVVEDDPNTLEVICEALDQQRYIYERATDADKALQLIDSFDPKIVLTDHDMPGLTGLEMLKELRQRENYTTVIFISARSESSIIAQALRAGADDYIRKPFRFEEMFARIEVALRTNDLHRDLLEANKKLKSLVDTDDLTGLFNMRNMYDRIDLELARAKRFDRKVAAVMLDMDKFKRVNDTNDHLFGSFVLKEMGGIIKNTMREIDFAARYGGDEFLILLTETNNKGAGVFCERLRENVEAYDFNDGKNQMKLTISLGFAMAQKSDDIDARDLVRRADHALYDAKENGRNRVSEYIHGQTKTLSQKEKTEGSENS